MNVKRITLSKYIYMPMVFLISAMLSIGILLYINKINAELHELYLLDDTVHEMQVLWLKAELLYEGLNNSDNSNNIDDIIADIDISISATDSMLVGGKLIHDSVIEPVKDTGLRKRIETIKPILVKYKNIIANKYSEEGNTAEGFPTNKIFNRFIDKTVELDEYFEVLQERHENKLERSFWIVLMLLSTVTLVVLIGVSVVEIRHKKLEQLKDEFVSTISHELRTPLSIIKESIYIAEKGREDGDTKKQIRFWEIAKNNAERLARLINNVLDYQKLCAGKMDFNPVRGDINKLIVNIGKEMQPLVEKKGLNLIVNTADDLPIIKFDEDKIMQVLVNLVNNAIKFTEKGRLSISTQKKGKYIYIRVKDDGVGIKKDEFEKLFKSFSKIGAEKKEGTGLGLAISKKIIEQHKGKIWANSKYSKGSTFYCALHVG